MTHTRRKGAEVCQALCLSGMFRTFKRFGIQGVVRPFTAALPMSLNKKTTGVAFFIAERPDHSSAFAGTLGLTRLNASIFSGILGYFPLQALLEKGFGGLQERLS